jgi:hypothetical protein
MIKLVTIVLISFTIGLAFSGKYGKYSIIIKSIKVANKTGKFIVFFFLIIFSAVRL